MKIRRLICMLLALVLCVSMLPPSVFAAEVQTEDASGYRIVVGDAIPEMQEYAAKELRKYLFQLSGEDVPIVAASESPDLTNAFVLGTLESNSLVRAVQTELDGLADTGAEGHEGEQGYVLKKADSTLYIAGTDDEGLLYGVYGLLDDYYGIGFYFSGDAIPEQKQALEMPEVDEAKTPRQYMRGVLPWTNFPQSATVYSLEDWTHIIDQMARMRMNFLNIHNYNGFPTSPRHNEMFHNFTYNGITSRQWNATAATGHGWAMPGWDVNKYLFGATDLFDDYDFGADATLHNENLDNLEVFAKGYTEFQYIIDYAHSRGVKMGLGIDADVTMPEYGGSSYTGNPAGADVPETQARTIAENYPELDVLILYKAEGLGSEADWKSVVSRVDSTLKAEDSSIRVAISGWGVTKAMADWAKTIDENIIVAPIASYQPDFEDETTYEGLEYWAGPWMEKDFDSSVYFYPFNFDLQQLIDCYQRNKDGMEGLFTLSWRLTDAVDAKIAYIAKAPWDLNEKYTTAEAVYGEYAEKCYGVGLDSDVIADLTDLICNDEKTVIPTLWSECRGTVNFTGNDRSADVAALQEMIDRVDAALAGSTDAGCADRLNRLRYRLVCAQSYCKLDQSFNATEWEHLQDDFSVWAQSFMKRVDDISSLGNNVSAQNRFVQQRYVARETALRNAQDIKAPLNVVAKGTYNGSILTWEYENQAAQGFYIYRNGEKLNDEPLSGDIRSFIDSYNGTAVYTITAVVDDVEGTASIPQTCDAGNADTAAPQAIVVSPSTSMRAGQDLKVKARLLDGRDYSELRAVIHYRALGSDEAFEVAPMENRAKATFTANVDTTAFQDTGIEYYLTVSDGKNQGVWPVTGGEDGLNAACTVYGEATAAPAAPTNVEAVDGTLTWDSVADAHWYRIYRDTNPDFTPSMANFVTYVAGSTTEFKDVATGFDGKSLSEETWYYRVAAVDRAMNESAPSEASNAVTPEEIPVNPLADTLFIEADELANSKAAEQDGSKSGKVVAFTKAPGYAKFEALAFSGEDSEVSFNAVDVTYATETSGGSMEIRLDSSDGPLVGSAEFPGTGGWGAFKTVSIELDPAITGTHDVYFVYKSESTGYLYNLDYFRFKYVSEQTAPPVVHDGTAITTNDMMAFRATTASGMKETISAIEDFGFEGDRIVLGKGYRADAENATMGGNTTVVNLPGYAPMKCFASFGAVGSNFGFTDLPGGKAYLGYDKWGNESGGLSVYVDDAQDPAQTLNPGSSGSDWDNPPHKIIYLDTGIELTEGQSIKFQNDVNNTGNTTKAMNGVKLFVEQSYTAKQLDIVYSNHATTQYSLYVDGVDTGEDIVFPNSNGVVKTVYIPGTVDGLIELCVDQADLDANGTAKTTIQSVLLCDQEYGAPESEKNTISVTVGEGGTVETEDGIFENGVVEINTGDTARLIIIPDAGYRVEQVKVNGAEIGAVRSYTFQQLNYDATLDVTFVEDTVVTIPKYDIDVSPVENGRITPAKYRAEEGETVNLDIVPAAGYRLRAGSLQVNGRRISEDAARFTMPAEAVTITGKFEPIGGSGGTGGGSATVSYTITVAQSEGGTITPATTSVEKGEDKTFTITANEGYKIADVLVDGKSVGAVSTYTFKNVTAKHTITAKFEKAGETTNVGGFIDVKSSDWFAKAVQYVVDEGLMNGTSSNTFSPYGDTTRGMIVTILYRLEQEPAVQSSAGFTDVAPNQYYADAVDWAAENGIVTGYGDGTFGPNNKVTREQLAAILYRYAAHVNADAGAKGELGGFKDASQISGYAEEALKWAVGSGLMTGKGNQTLDPKGNATRAEVATMLMRLCEEITK